MLESYQTVWVSVSDGGGVGTSGFTGTGLFRCRPWATVLDSCRYVNDKLEFWYTEDGKRFIRLENSSSHCVDHRLRDRVIFTFVDIVADHDGHTR